MATTTHVQRRKHDSEIRVGDVLVFMGMPHRIARIDPPTPETLAINPECIGFARGADGWGITLSGHLPVGIKIHEVA